MSKRSCQVNNRVRAAALDPSTAEEQTDNRRCNGQFVKGNTLGVRYQPGQSGNPNGRPAGQSITAELRSLLGSKRLRKELARRWVEQALAGNFKHLSEILDRTEGKVPDELIGEVRHLVMRFATLSDVELALERSRSVEVESHC